MVCLKRHLRVVVNFQILPLSTARKTQALPYTNSCRNTASIELSPDRYDIAGRPGNAGVYFRAQHHKAISARHCKCIRPESRETILAVSMCVCVVALVSVVVTLLVSGSDFVRGDPGVLSTDNLFEMKLTSGRPNTKAEETVSTPHMGGSPRVTVQPVSTLAPTARPSPTTSPATTSTTTPPSTTTTLAPVKAIICTVGETATSVDMYPSEYCDYIFYTNVYPRSGQIDVSGHSNRSWTVFQEVAAKRSNIEFGVSFSFQIIPLEYLDEAAGSLDALRRRGIRHYGFLTGLYFEADYEYAFMQTRAVIAKLKGMQASDRTAKTVFAFGLYQYSDRIMPTVKAVVANVTNTFMVDIVIAIISTGWDTSARSYYAIPPNSARTDNLGQTALLTLHQMDDSALHLGVPTLHGS
ncbi:uncharacterized protein LOC142768312 [Rhipicephalus microplus]|uniref:uncharacterized protein LOC142768312 n=1 Tax=Rhipicephalus microplus TaxID=6941 RepID=UPI003F6CE6CE